MPILTIKNAVNVALPSGNEIPMPILIGALEQIIDDYYLELNSKVDVVAGYGLSQEDFTTTLFNKLNSLTVGYLGLFPDSAALNAAHPVGIVGQFATIATTDTLWTWDDDTTAWIDTGNGSFGDMLASVYDPGAIAANVFDMDNMVEGTSLILTQTERDKINLKAEYFTGGVALATITVSTNSISDNANFRVMVEGQEWYDSSKITGGNISVNYGTGVITPLIDWEDLKIKVIFN